MGWLDLLAVQGTLKSFLQHHSSKASILQRSAFFIVQLSHPYITTGKTIALTRWIFIGKVMSLLFNMLSRLVITFLQRRKHLLISWLHQPYPIYPQSISQIRPLFWFPLSPRWSDPRSPFSCNTRSLLNWSNDVHHCNPASHVWAPLPRAAKVAFTKPKPDLTIPPHPPPSSRKPSVDRSCS